MSLTTTSIGGNAKVIRSGNVPTPRAPRKNKPRPQHGGKSINRVSFSQGKSKVRPAKPQATPASTKPKKIATVSTNLKKKAEITIGNGITVKEYSEKT
jgi:hypothetical protein